MSRIALADIKWVERFYGSGSMVISSNLPDMPHYRFGYPFKGLGGEKERDRIRYETVHAVTNMLNGGQKIDRWNRVVRPDDNQLVLWNGMDIYAAGPSYDASRDGSLNWKERPGYKWDLRRKELIDHLVDLLWSNQ